MSVGGIVEFLTARLDERCQEMRPRTVGIDGPAPEVPNCHGVSGTGDCGWTLTVPDHSGAGWWRAPEVTRAILAHELTHANAEQRLVLAEVEAKRRIVHAHNRPHHCTTLTAAGEGQATVSREPWELWEDEFYEVGQPCPTLLALALPYAEHPDHLPEWSRDAT